MPGSRHNGLSSDQTRFAAVSLALFGLCLLVMAGVMVIAVESPDALGRTCLTSGAVLLAGLGGWMLWLAAYDAGVYWRSRPGRGATP